MSNDASASASTTTTCTRHIRPTVRRRRGGGVGPSPSAVPPAGKKASGGDGDGDGTDLDSLLEGTRRRMMAASKTHALSVPGTVVHGGSTAEVPSPPTGAGEAAASAGRGEGRSARQRQGSDDEDRPASAAPVSAAGKRYDEPKPRSKPRGILRERPKYSSTAARPSGAASGSLGSAAPPAMVIPSAHGGDCDPDHFSSCSGGLSSAIEVLPHQQPPPSPSVGPDIVLEGACREEEEIEASRPLVRDIVVERDPRAVAAVAAPTASARKSAAVSSESPRSDVPSSLSPSSVGAAYAAIAVEGYGPSIDGGSGGGPTSLPPLPSRKRGGARPSPTEEKEDVPSTSTSGGRVPPNTRPPSVEPTQQAAAPQDGGPTIVRSISELVALARGTSDEAAEGKDLPSDHPRSKGDGGDGVDGGGEVENAAQFETDVSFACMTEAEYEKTLEMARKMRLNDGGGDAAEKNEPGVGSKGEGETDDETADDDDGEDHGGQMAEPNDVEEGDLFEEQEYDEGGGPSMEEVFFGRRDVFGPDEDEEDSVMDYDDAEGEGAGSFLDFFSNDDDDSIGEDEPEPRPFLALWRAISAWITPDAADILAEWSGAPAAATTIEPTSLRPPYDRTDVGASRCAGLMSMLKMNLPRSLEELGYDRTDSHVRRLAEKRLATFVRGFDFTEPMVKFDSKMWRAMTVLLVDICLQNGSVLYPDVVAASNRTDCRSSDGEDVPPTIKSLEVSIEEYRYLTEEAIPSLSLGGS